MNYNKLWKLLIDKNMKKKDLREATGLTMKCHHAESPERIVSVIAIENDSVIKDWGYRKPIKE